MSHYETVFILTPVLSDAQMKEAVDKFASYLTSASTTVVNDEHWGLRKLAYPIEKKSIGLYHFIGSDAESLMIKPFETLMRHDETVLRYITIAQDKFHHTYTEKHRALKSNLVAER